MLPSNKCEISSLKKMGRGGREGNGTGLNWPGILGQSPTPDSIFILV